MTPIALAPSHRGLTCRHGALTVLFYANVRTTKSLTPAMFGSRDVRRERAQWDSYVGQSMCRIDLQRCSLSQDLTVANLTFLSVVLNSLANTSDDVPRVWGEIDDGYRFTRLVRFFAWSCHVYVHGLLSGGSPGRICTTSLGTATTREGHLGVPILTDRSFWSPLEGTNHDKHIYIYTTQQCQYRCRRRSCGGHQGRA